MTQHETPHRVERDRWARPRSPRRPLRRPDLAALDNPHQRSPLPRRYRGLGLLPRRRTSTTPAGLTRMS